MEQRSLPLGEPDNMLANYILEAELPISLKELRDSVEYILPLRIDKDVVNKEGEIVLKAGEVSGFIGMDVVPSTQLGNVAVIKLIYIVPKARRSFKVVVKNVFEFLKVQGFRMIEIHSTRKINNWMSKHLHSKPNTFIHLGDVNEYLRRLDT